MHTFKVTYPESIDIARSLELFRRWGDDLLDRWDGHALIRTLRVQGKAIPYVCECLDTTEGAAIRVHVIDAEHEPRVREVVRRMFVTAPAALAELALLDPVVQKLVTQFPGIRPVLQPDLFSALVRSISAQQVNLAFAVTVRRRLAESYGQCHTVGPYRVMSLEPERLAMARVTDLRALQFTHRKSEYIIALARAVCDGSLSLEALRHAPDDEVIVRLTALRGLGRWTAEWFLARALGRARVSAGDLGVRKAIAALYGDGRMPSEGEVRDLTAHWGEAAGVVQQLALEALHDLEDRHKQVQ